MTWTFRRIVKAARESGKEWQDNDGEIRCATGFCPLGVVFMLPRKKRTRLPFPEVPELRTGAERLAAWRVAYASDCPVSPDRDALLKGLGLR